MKKKPIIVGSVVVDRHCGGDPAANPNKIINSKNELLAGRSADGARHPIGEVGVTLLPSGARFRMSWLAKIRIRHRTVRARSSRRSVKPLPLLKRVEAGRSVPDEPNIVIIKRRRRSISRSDPVRRGDTAPRSWRNANVAAVLAFADIRTASRCDRCRRTVRCARSFTARRRSARTRREVRRGRLGEEQDARRVKTGKIDPSNKDAPRHGPR
jgi:hypothetical protein